MFLNYVDRGAVGIAAPLMKSDLDLTATEFGLIVSAFFWVYAPVQLLVGWLVDRFSVYRLMAGGVLLWAVATLAMGFAGGFTSLLVLRIMLGVGETIAFPGGSKIITRHVPPEQRGIANAALALGHRLRSGGRDARRRADPRRIRLAGDLHRLWPGHPALAGAVAAARCASSTPRTIGDRAPCAGAHADRQMAVMVDVDRAHRQQLRLLFPARLAAVVTWSSRAGCRSAT